MAPLTTAAVLAILLAAALTLSLAFLTSEEEFDEEPRDSGARDAGSVHDWMRQ
jgi:uncharacterized membrane protein YdfJ with MMPL/SSD domain